MIRSSPNNYRLIVDPPADGAWNMAVDEALIEAVAEDLTPTLRIYRWERPTLSLGYFQSYADRASHAASNTADVVRRLSGGGAILHDQELTYSLILPADHPLAADTQALYNAVHRGIIAWLNPLVPKTSAWRLLLNDEKSIEQPFLCFQRRAPGDVLLVDGASDHKIVGSAQRRRQGGVLQHGSILWATSTAAPELCGFAQLAAQTITLDEAARQLSVQLSAVLQLQGDPATLSAELSKSAENKRENRYKTPAWTQRR